jgi:G:T-mismatch repair DNA endonuclease (very short patch repair protein)
MQEVKANGSIIETTLAKALFARGHRYRKKQQNSLWKARFDL